MRGLAALRSRHARDEVEIAGAASPFSVDRGPVMSSGGGKRQTAAGRLRLSAASASRPPSGRASPAPGPAATSPAQTVVYNGIGRWACVTPRAGKKGVSRRRWTELLAVAERPFLLETLESSLGSA